MSFGDVSDSGMAGMSSSPYSPTSHVSPISEQLRGKVAAMRANNASLRRMSGSLIIRTDQDVADEDAESVRASNISILRRLRILRVQNRELAHAAGMMAPQLPVDDPSRIAFEDAVAEFGEALKQSMEREKIAVVGDFQIDSTPPDTSPGSSPSRTSRSMNDGDAREALVTEQSPLLMKDSSTKVALQEEEEKRSRQNYGGFASPSSSQQQSYTTTHHDAVLREIQSNELLRRERDAAMREVQTSIEDVNAIFKDLALMVGEQNAQVEYVELHIGDAADNMKAAKKQLDRAQRKREKRKRFFFFMLLCIALFVAFLLLILLS